MLNSRSQRWGSILASYVRVDVSRLSRDRDLNNESENRQSQSRVFEPQRKETEEKELRAAGTQRRAGGREISRLAK
jgi:hypothetical protein